MSTIKRPQVNIWFWLKMKASNRQRVSNVRICRTRKMKTFRPDGESRERVWGVRSTIPGDQCDCGWPWSQAWDEGGWKNHSAISKPLYSSSNCKCCSVIQFTHFSLDCQLSILSFPQLFWELFAACWKVYDHHPCLTLLQTVEAACGNMNQGSLMTGNAFHAASAQANTAFDVNEIVWQTHEKSEIKGKFLMCFHPAQIFSCSYTAVLEVGHFNLRVMSKKKSHFMCLKFHKKKNKLHILFY